VSADNEKSRSMAALQLAQWLLLRLVNSNVIPRDEAAHWLKQAIDRNINGNADHVKIAKIFENLLSAIKPRGKPKPDHPMRKKSK
jgi:hypothetical protein